jgi:hypothetical protein
MSMFAGAGAGLSLAAGLLTGAAMRPELIGDEGPASAQAPEPAAGPASDPFDNERAAYARYSGKLPEYVIGTDWTRPPKVAVAEPAPDEPAQENVDYYERPFTDLTDPPMAAEDHARPVAYWDTPADIDSDAPPEATGDTTAATSDG